MSGHRHLEPGPSYRHSGGGCRAEDPGRLNDPVIGRFGVVVILIKGRIIYVLKDVLLIPG